jgi:hypothetical protein
MLMIMREAMGKLRHREMSRAIGQWNEWLELFGEPGLRRQRKNDHCFANLLGAFKTCTA